MKRRNLGVYAIRVFAYTLCFSMLCKMPALALTSETVQCGLLEHTHTDECYSMQRELICTENTSDIFADGGIFEDNVFSNVTGHIHSDSCYGPESLVLICTVPEHIHSDECFVYQEDVTGNDVFPEDVDEGADLFVPPASGPMEIPQDEGASGIDIDTTIDLPSVNQSTPQRSVDYKTDILNWISNLPSSDFSSTRGTGLINLNFNLQSWNYTLNSAAVIYKVTVESPDGRCWSNIYSGSVSATGMSTVASLEDVGEEVIPEGAKVTISVPYYSTSCVYVSPGMDEGYLGLYTSEYPWREVPASVIESYDPATDYTILSNFIYRTGVVNTTVMLNNAFDRTPDSGDQETWTQMFPETGGPGINEFAISGMLMVFASLLIFQRRREYD